MCLLHILGEKLFQSESQEGLLPLECGPVCPGQIPLSSKHLPFSQFGWKLEFVQARWPPGEARWKSWCEPRSLVSFSQAVASHGHMHILAFSVILPFGGRTQECCGAPWRVGENPGVVRRPMKESRGGRCPRVRAFCPAPPWVTAPAWSDGGTFWAQSRGCNHTYCTVVARIKCQLLGARELGPGEVLCRGQILP